MAPKRKRHTVDNAGPSTSTSTGPAGNSRPAKSKRSKGEQTVAGTDQSDLKSKREIRVPVDERFTGAADGETPEVYVDGNDGSIYDASLNQTNIGVNANKFYRLQLIDCGKPDRYYVHTRWGRVGELGQVKHFGPYSVSNAIEIFRKKFKDKSGWTWDDRHSPAKNGKYTFLVRDYAADGEEGDMQIKKAAKDEKGSEDAFEGMKQGGPEITSHDDDTLLDANGHDEGMPVSKLPQQTKRLMELIFDEKYFEDVLENIGYNNDKLPLGKLGETTLKQGFSYLNELATMMMDPALAMEQYQMSQVAALDHLSNRYYSTIPHVFGRHAPPRIDNTAKLRREVEMLDTLTDMEVAQAIMNIASSANSKDKMAEVDQRFAQLNLKEATPLDRSSKEYCGIREYLVNTVGETHGLRYELVDIFRIEREGEEQRFMNSKFAKIGKSDRRLLWHGSRTTNFGGILSQGLRIAPREAPVNGYAFGKGVYLADISSKSANYCMTAHTGADGLLLLCEAELGNPMLELKSGSPTAEEQCKAKGSIATYGKGNTKPAGWIDAGYIHEGLRGVKVPDTSKPPVLSTGSYLYYNEYICYDVAQIRLRYLLRFIS